MIPLWNEIDRLKGPDALTKETAKLNTPAEGLPGYAYEVREMKNGSIQFRRLTPVNEYLITVRVKRRKVGR